MIHITRTKFDALPSALQNDLIARQNAVDNDEITTDAAWEAFKKEERQDLVQALKDDFHNKCAYCEIGLDKTGDIEHFWPKKPHSHNKMQGTAISGFTSKGEIAGQGGIHGLFVWNNLLWSCKTCNGFGFKVSQMDRDETGQIKLLNPCVDDPYYYLLFGTNGIERGRVYPKEVNQERAEYTIGLLQLDDREQGLVKPRAEKMKNFLLFVDFLRMKQKNIHISLAGISVKEQLAINEILTNILNADTELLTNILNKNSAFLAPIRQLLFDPAFAAPSYNTLYDELKVSLPGLDDVLAEWNAIPK